MLLLISCFELFWAICLVFLPCEIAERLSYAFDGINRKIDQFHWYLFSFEMKKMLPMILLNAQQPVSLNCFGSIQCNRETFKMVSKFFIRFPQ